MRRATLPWLLACGWLVVPAGTASAQPDAQIRWPALGRGDLLLVRGTGVLPHLDSGVGLDADLVREPIVLFDRALGLERAAVATRLTTTVLYGVGLAGHSQLTLAVPLVWQEGEGRRVLTLDPADELPHGVAGDVRLDFLHSLTRECDGGCVVDAALASGVVVPTGDEGAFAGEAGFAAYLEAAVHGRVGPIALSGSWGIRVRRDAALSDVALGSELPLSAAVALELLDARLVLAAEAQALVGLRGGSSSPVIALFEARGRLGAHRQGEVALGLGAGLNDELRAPSIEAVLSVRYLPR